MVVTLKNEDATAGRKNEFRACSPPMKSEAIDAQTMKGNITRVSQTANSLGVSRPNRRDSGSGSSNAPRENTKSTSWGANTTPTTVTRTLTGSRTPEDPPKEPMGGLSSFPLVHAGERRNERFRESPLGEHLPKGVREGVCRVEGVEQRGREQEGEGLLPDQAGKAGENNPEAHGAGAARQLPFVNRARRPQFACLRSTSPEARPRGVSALARHCDSVAEGSAAACRQGEGWVRVRGPPGRGAGVNTGVPGPSLTKGQKRMAANSVRCPHDRGESVGELPLSLSGARRQLRVDAGAGAAGFGVSRIQALLDSAN